jgi:hypothetical protein
MVFQNKIVAKNCFMSVLNLSFTLPAFCVKCGRELISTIVFAANERIKQNKYIKVCNNVFNQKKPEWAAKTQP